MKFCRWWKRSLSISLRCFIALMTMLSKCSAALMPIFVPSSVAKKVLQHHFMDDVRETNGTSTAWWWAGPLGCSQRPQRGADLCTSITPRRHAQAEKVGFGVLSCKHMGLLTSPWPTCSLFWHLLLCTSFSVTWQCRSIPAACRDSLASILGSWGRTEKHCGYSSHPSQDLKFPLSTWHFHRIYLLFKGFKQTLQATVEVLTDVQLPKLKSGQCSEDSDLCRKSKC